MSDIEDRKARARLQFDRLDKDGDGQISLAEYREVMAKLGEFPEDTVRAIFDKKDTDGDGVVSFEEFWASLKA
ncbi:EF-hand domain-containing protein [Actinocorallia herbida]|uniref:EF-hand domain-containing protein n=1 Tax=Actinocorallia herbida TaxID=58109 RepID=UPI000F4CB2DA|nr:EF-hand domain-containing protein [Actinocorallia herbida]